MKLSESWTRTHADRALSAIIFSASARDPKTLAIDGSPSL